MKKTELALGLLIVVFAVGLFVLTRRTAEETPQVQAHTAPSTTVSSEVPLTPITFTEPTTKTNAPAAQPAPQLAQTSDQPTQNAQSSPPAGDLADPTARDALALVGADDGADLYWVDAIFDTSLPDNERADLMEDLNEVGFDDPKNLTADDQSLILSRLEIIDAVLPDADDFMIEHLTEAQKDLIDMLASATNPPQQ